METIDPATGRPLPADAIQRILFVAKSVHVYNIPPLASLKGYKAASWTEDPKRNIFSCRLRIIETSVARPGGTGEDEDEEVKADIVLEDPSTGQLFAAAPYVDPAVVEPAIDSSRFFALRVQDGAGRKATLGIGFEERSEAFDFGVGLQEAQKSLSLAGGAAGAAWAGSGSGSGLASAGGRQAGQQAAAGKAERRDYSLKEGETITVNLGGAKLGRKARPQGQQQQGLGGQGASLSSFALPPPPSANAPRGSGILPPPPGAPVVKSQQEKQERQGQGSTSSTVPQKSAQDLGFDDGQFGEFA